MKKQDIPKNETSRFALLSLHMIDVDNKRKSNLNTLYENLPQVVIFILTDHEPTVQRNFQTQIVLILFAIPVHCKSLVAFEFVCLNQ